MARVVREYETKHGILQTEHSRNTEVGSIQGDKSLDGRIKQGRKAPATATITIYQRLILPDPKDGAGRQPPVDLRAGGEGAKVPDVRDYQLKF